MPELTDRESPNVKRLVLCFDAGCMACSEMAHRLHEQVGEKLEVLSLRNPVVQQWRESALGDDAPWAPTLIEIKDSRVRAWTGPRMGIALSRTLGPKATWRVMQVLGELAATAAAERLEGSRVGTLAEGISRGQFLKGLGGAAVAVSVLAGGLGIIEPLSWATPAEARDGKVIVSNKLATGTQLSKDETKQAVDKASKDPDGKLLWDYLRGKGYKPAADHAQGLMITGTGSSKSKGDFVSLTIPFREVNDLYPILFFTKSTKSGSKPRTGVGVYKRDEKTDKASSVDVYEIVKGSVKHTRTVKGPFGRHTHHRNHHNTSTTTASPSTTQETTDSTTIASPAPQKTSYAADQYGGGGGGESICEQCKAGRQELIHYGCPILGGAVCVAPCAAFSLGIATLACGPACGLLSTVACEKLAGTDTEANNCSGGSNPPCPSGG